MDMEKLTLDNICEGAAHELFDQEVEGLLKNIADPNTKTSEKRKITLEFTFSPSPDMSYMGVECSVKSKMSHIAPVSGGAPSCQGRK